MFSERTEDKEETGKKGIESKIRIRRRSYGALSVRAERKKKKKKEEEAGQDGRLSGLFEYIGGGQ